MRELWAAAGLTGGRWAGMRWWGSAAAVVVVVEEVGSPGPLTGPHLRMRRYNQPSSGLLYPAAGLILPSDDGLSPCLDYPYTPG